MDACGIRAILHRAKGRRLPRIQIKHRDSVMKTTLIVIQNEADHADA
jgi:hypothetical protein